MRLFHCVWISSLVILGLLLTSTNLSNKDVSKTLNGRNVGKTVNDALGAAGKISDGQFDGDMWSSNTSLTVSYRAWDSSGGCKAYRKKHPLELWRFDTQLSLSCLISWDLIFHLILCMWMYGGDRYFGCYLVHLFLFSFYWSDLRPQTCVALSNLWWSINKNQIENQTSPELVMIIRMNVCWFLGWIYRSSQFCSLLSVE